MTEQKIVGSTYDINKHLSDGWRVVPGTIAAAGYGMSYTGIMMVWAVLEREVEEVPV